MSKTYGSEGSVSYLKAGAKLSIDKARTLLAQRGYTLGAGSFNAQTKTASYSVTNRSGKTITLTAKQIQRRLTK